MPHYEWTGSRPFLDDANDRRIQPGDVVELDESIAGGHQEFVPADDPKPTCVGNDGECSREVEEEGGRCWQHSEDGSG